MKLEALIGRDGALQGYIHWCPGCKQFHAIETVKPNRWGAIWRFDGNEDRPTFTPSINVVGQCHYFIRAGEIQFCSDSKHRLAGKTVPMPDVDEGHRYNDACAAGCPPDEGKP